MYNNGNSLRSFFFIIIFSLFTLFIQTTWLPRFSFFGIFPDLILILVCLTGIFKGPFWGGFTGVYLGFLFGMLNRHFFLTFFLWLILGVLVGLFRSNIFNNLPALGSTSCILGTWFSCFIYWTLTALFLQETFYTPLETILLSSLLNGLLAYLLFPLFKYGLALNRNNYE